MDVNDKYKQSSMAYQLIITKGPLLVRFVANQPLLWGLSADALETLGGVKNRG